MGVLLLPSDLQWYVIHLVVPGSLRMADVCWTSVPNHHLKTVGHFGQKDNIDNMPALLRRLFWCLRRGPDYHTAVRRLNELTHCHTSDQP